MVAERWLGNTEDDPDLKSDPGLVDDPDVESDSGLESDPGL